MRRPGQPTEPGRGRRDAQRQQAAAPQERTAGRGWLIAAGAVVVVLVVIVGFIVRGVSGIGDPSAGPGGQRADRPICPDFDLRPPTETAIRDGRVYGGKLSYPVLPAPWSAPSQETRVPYGRNAWTQNIHVEPFTQGGSSSSWVASVMVAELNAGDGFFTPQQGSEIVVTCVVGAFYGDAKVTRNDTVNRAITVDGHDAWVVESDLSFRIPGLRTDGEWLMVVIVETGEGTASLYSASIPNTSPQWEAPARQAMSELRVDG